MDECLTYLETLPSLKDLDLDSCSRITNVGAKSLTSLKALRKLHLCRCYAITDGCLTYSMTLMSLRDLDPRWCSKTTNGGAKLLALLIASTKIDLVTVLKPRMSV